ncbi:hypothetical protein [Pseudonocardia xinjiangensis]|uniref:Uncharacterized protein n=1 Tax=Pseudonocardia xinjiangensis TaxID=75289 RepID=A0ABX1R927_9PSEU|nr:hypothetical protein [Pseudonocardia xinjiangensis]NMH75686.1 hypothetical protein [Pseudonocardia xinjiangensis]
MPINLADQDGAESSVVADAVLGGVVAAVLLVTTFVDVSPPTSGWVALAAVVLA